MEEKSSIEEGMHVENSAKTKPSIYLIDDDPDSIMGIVRSVFPAMWQVDKQEGNETNICVFGNAETVAESSSTPWNTQDEEEFSRKIEDVLWFLCHDWEMDQGDDLKDEEEGNKFNDKVSLVRGKVHILYKSDDEDALKKEYEEIYRIWTGNVTETEENVDQNFGETDQTFLISKNARKMAEKLIDRMKIPKNAKVILDLSLLWDDIERTLEGQQPLLSMQLYHLLKEDHKCFLYSKYVMVDNFIKAWKDMYKKYFPEDGEPEIYHKSELAQKEITGEMLGELTNIADS